MSEWTKERIKRLTVAEVRVMPIDDLLHLQDHMGADWHAHDPLLGRLQPETLDAIKERLHG